VLNIEQTSSHHYELFSYQYIAGRGGMGAKIQSAIDAVKPGSSCTACIIVSGNDHNCIRAILGRKHDPSLGPPKGTLFATIGSSLFKMASNEFKEENVSIYIHIIYAILFLWQLFMINFTSNHCSQKVRALYQMKQEQWQLLLVPKLGKCRLFLMKTGKLFFML
jgi:hypothetical protein